VLAGARPNDNGAIPRPARGIRDAGACGEAARKNKKSQRALLSFFFGLLIPAAALGAAEIRDSEIERAVAAWAAPVAAAAGMPSIKVRILEDGALNAFVAGGGDIFVNTGLIARIDSAAELQAVLAHEIGHSALGHLAQLGMQTRAETMRGLVAGALGIGLLFVNPLAATGLIAGAGGMFAQGMMAFTRDEERAADDYAARLLAMAGIDVSALLSVFKKMQTFMEAEVNPNNIGHPLTEERMKNIRLHIGGPLNATQDPAHLKMIQAKLAGYLDPPGRVATLYPAKDVSDAALYARAIARMRGGELDIAKKGAASLASRHPNNPYFYELLGDIEFRRGQYDASVRMYENSLKLLAGAPQIELALALVLSERGADGDADRATSLAKRAILAEPMPLAWWVLAKSDSARADYYMAEYHLMMRDAASAKKHAKAAVKKLPKGSPEAVKARDILE
jgi:predicted Zn-dependent protease